MKHGYSGNKSRTYRSWLQLRNRCLNPNNASYADYGGRGIKVDARWTSFENFLADMGERPEGTSIDRIDNDGNYEPGNCRWATPVEQANNQRPHAPRTPGTHCRRGHPFTHTVKHGKKRVQVCGVCQREAVRRHRAR